jgi:hypothetical protein
MPAGNFVCAALPSVHTQMINTIKELKETGGEDLVHKFLSEESLDSFFKENVNKFLTSIGIILPRLPNQATGHGKSQFSTEVAKIRKNGPRITKNNIEKYSEILKKFNNTPFLKNCELIIDSAGFQIQQFYLDNTEIPTYIDLFHDEFMANRDNEFDWAFTLDIAPGGSHCPFDTFEEMEQLCRHSYSKASALPEDIRNKMLYIHHFRTIKIHKIYKKLLDDYGQNFTNFSTGGLVSFGRSGSPPFIMYAIPLIEVLNHVLDRGLTSFRFHVLGGSEWKEILGHKFFERHIKEEFGIDVQITYDSTTLFKTLCLGRYTFRPDETTKTIKKLSLREADLHQFDDALQDCDNYKELFYDLVNESVRAHGMAGLEYGIDEIYVTGNKQTSKYSKLEREFAGFGSNREGYDGRITRLAYSYGMLQILRLFKVVENWCEDYVDELYPQFIDGLNNKDTQSKLNHRIEEIMILLNGGNSISKNINLKAVTIGNTLELISEFKRDRAKGLAKCDHLVNAYMMKDECHDLRPKSHKVNMFI